MRPYTRSLDPEDYHFLVHTAPLRQFQQDMVRNGVQHREWHPHRFWEYASMMQQLDELQVPKTAMIVDVGSGGSFFPPYLVTVGEYPNVEVTDSMKYGDVRPILDSQRQFYNIDLPLHDLPCEDMTFADDTFDVTMCISTIEHVDDHDAAMREMVRITKPGGFIFITSDYFRNLEQFEQSVSRHLQVTPYREEFVLEIPEKFGLEFVGPTDLGYRGDFVHNYSFVNVCLRRPL